MMTDPIADLLTRLRNAYSARHDGLEVAHSELKYTLLKILEKHKYVTGIETLANGPKKTIKISIQERDLEETSPNFVRKSKPGQRMYIDATSIRPVNNGYGISIISTSKGVMTGYEAKKAGLGGEYICEVY